MNPALVDTVLTIVLSGMVSAVAIPAIYLWLPGGGR